MAHRWGGERERGERERRRERERKKREERERRERKKKRERERKEREKRREKREREKKEREREREEREREKREKREKEKREKNRDEKKAEIIVVGAWNNAITRLRETDPLLRSLNTTIGRVAASARARFADTFPRFNPRGNVGREKARICALTFTCSRGDGHPTDAGYRTIAAAIWAASGYAQRR